MPKIGTNGLPVIKCDVTIKSNTTASKNIQRNSTAAAFRIFGVASTGKLTLNNILVTGGKATLTGGGGILSVQGAVVLTNGTVVSGNSATISTGAQILGGGVYSYHGSLTIDHSTITANTNNSSAGDGGGLGVIDGAFNMTNSVITNNVAARDGGGLTLLFIANPVVTLSNFVSNTSATNSGTGIFVGGNSSGTSVTNSCIKGNPSVSFLSSGVVSNATDNWWGNGDGPNTTGADTTNGFAFVNDSNPKPYLPYFCTTSAALTDYGVYVAVQGGSTTLQQSFEATILSALEVTSGALATKYGYSFNPQYAFQPDPVKFKKIMLGNDANQIGFVFMNLQGVSIPINVNAASQTSWVPTPPATYTPVPPVSLDYRTYGRICPFYIDLGQSGGSSGLGTTGLIPNNVSSQLPAGTISVIGSKATQAHQALIVCDINYANGTLGSSHFIDWTAVYNLGQVFLYENGGVQSTASVSGTQVPTFYSSFQNGVIRDGLNNLEMGIANDGFVCKNYGNIPTKLADDAGLTASCQQQAVPVRNPVYGDWRRGQRGWGSPAEPVTLPKNGSATTGDYIRNTCGWQENPVDALVDIWIPTPNAIRKTGANDSAPSEYVSTAGDMFLNWVYRYNLKAPQRDLAFGNYNWDSYSQQCPLPVSGTPDPSNPGDARFNYMQTAVPTRFIRP